MNGHILIVDDDVNLCEMLAESLAHHDFSSAWETSASAALERASSDEFDVVVTDINMRGMTGIELCKCLADRRPDVPVVMVTAFGSLDTAVGAMRAGAYDFITKPFDVDAVALSLDRAVKHRALRDEVRRLRRAVSDGEHFGEFLGKSPAMRRVYELLGRLTDSEASVLVTGESGTGKELVARALHSCSQRAAAPFVAVNCAALPATLLENELFGHVRGAYTDARTAKTGLLVHASGGTLFLDEIGDMPLEIQAKILRALEERSARPVGGDREIPFDTRIVAATHRDLDEMVEQGRFREDLFYRINVVHVAMPPLRARGEDVLLLAQEFLHTFATRTKKSIQGLSSRAAEKLLSYPWPGNVRELKNAMERAVALSEYDSIAVDDLPEKVRNHRHSHVLVASDDPTELVPLDEVERRYILRVVEAVGGNKTQAAAILRLDRKTLYRKLESYH
jgi:DNA-binding NtrC family response regulator